MARYKEIRTCHECEGIDTTSAYEQIMWCCRVMDKAICNYREEEGRVVSVNEIPYWCPLPILPVVEK